jgi:sirohydrochlorin ferrochelatase
LKGGAASMGQWGVLVIGHGSSRESWLNMVINTVEKADISVPCEVVFLEMVPDRTIQSGVDRLESLGVTDILVIPLFVSEGSTHIDEIKYAFGLIDTIPIDSHLPVIHTRSFIHFGQTLDAHPLIVEILLERLQRMSVQPEAEYVVLAGHGSDKPGYLDKWARILESLSGQLMSKGGFAGVAGATTLPDTLKEEVARHQDARVLVLPLFLSEGYFTEKVIPRKLAGLDYIYTGEAYLPHPNISRWISEQVAQSIVMKA